MIFPDFPPFRKPTNEGPMPISEADEKRRVARELKDFLSVNRISRKEFVHMTKLGSSTVDKLLIGLYSDNTLAIILDRTGFKLNTSYASKIIGGYSKINWREYIYPYLMLHPCLDGTDAIIACHSQIEWNDSIPGLVLYETINLGQTKTEIGSLWIDSEKASLIYVQPMNKIGVRLVLSTMVRQAVMRGLSLLVDNVLANAYVPVANPVVLKRLNPAEKVDRGSLGRIGTDHPLYREYGRELRMVIDRRFGRLIGAPELHP